MGMVVDRCKTLPHSCVEPNKFDFGAMFDSDGILVLNLIHQTLQNKKENNSPTSRENCTMYK